MKNLSGLQEEVFHFLSQATRILVFTGAGISTQSGIPDFRGPKGVWKRRQPVYFDEFLRSEQKRIEYWEYKLEGYESFRKAKPNRTHQSIATLESMGRVQIILTQNIDGLHQEAGSSRVLELHGSNCFTQCLSCQKRAKIDAAIRFFEKNKTPPLCDCGGFLKPATISFGQSLLPETLQKAEREAKQCDLVIALGSTLSVEPAASLALLPVSLQKPYLIINQGDTAHDTIATRKIDEEISKIFSPAVLKLQNILSNKQE